MTIKNPKTTISGVIGAIAYVLPLFGLDVPKEITDSIAGLAILLIGVFARDGVTVGGVKVELNPSILPERNRTAEIRKNISDKNKIGKVN